MTAKKGIFISLLLIIQVCLIWPVYPLVSDVRPMVFGLPFSFFWVILMLLASFLLVLWYYRTETTVEDDWPPAKSSRS